MFSYILLFSLSILITLFVSPPYSAFDEPYRDAPRRALRSVRKAIGLPASGDVAALSRMVRDLKCKAEAFLGIKISSIALVAATPTLTALYEEDLVDAFEYAGLQLATICRPRKDVSETSAAYAGYGYGYGLGSNYGEPQSRTFEISNTPAEDVLSILYTRGVLRTIYTTVRSAYYMFTLDCGWTLDWDLGFDARNDDDYWQRVADALQLWKRTLPGSKGPTKVLLLGDCAGDKTFRSVLEKSLRDTVLEMPRILAEGSEFIAARGAAELARRSVYVAQDKSRALEIKE